MRSFIGATLVAVSGLCLSASGCGDDSGDSTATDASSGAGATGGEGGNGTGAAGGTGGSDCVPESEICDGTDNDCDDEIDEGCTCTEGQTQECYTGRPMRTKGVGACKAGTQTCGADGKWPAGCPGEVTPAVEDCNSEDDDCNGTADDMGDVTCGVGVCQVTVVKCENGQLNSCTPGQPSVELCDGLDNDCDQQADESFPNQGAACDSGLLGVCQPGTNQCVAATPTCVPTGMPSLETCDDLDNDCDGTPDDNIPGTGGECTTGGFGVCAQGTVSCQGGVIDCFPITPSSPEVCDGLDNNCDDQTDEGDPGSGAACGTGLPGACAAGTLHCVSGAIDCVPNNSGTPEVCNGQDDDCDGTNDNGDPGAGVACGCGGTTACVSGGIVCQGGPAVYFEETFANNLKGWTPGPEWAIGSAATGCTDPATDHTPTSDNGVAGVVLGGCYSTSPHTFSYLTSPIINTAAAPAVWFEYWRWLQSYFAPSVVNTIDVFNGTTWVNIYQTGASPGVSDTSWVKQQFNITAHKNAAMRIRFGFNVFTGALSDGGWNVDDIKITAAACP